MDPTTKIQFYKDARAKVEASVASNQPLEIPLIMKCLALIKDDVEGSSQATRAAATDMLLFLMGVKSAEVQTEVMKFTQENSGDEVLQKCIINSLRKVVLDRIIGGDGFLEMLQVWLPYKDKIPLVVEEICKSHIPPDKCKHLFLNTIIPSMMTEENLDVDVRTVLIDLAFRLSCIVPISNLNPDEADVFLKNIGTRYVVAITKLRDVEYCNWHKLWMFLVRYSGKYLHNSMDLTNKLLRVVEFAFRNVNYLQRLRGYDCWKELIDNASLDKTYISSNKQLKLLVTPLKAKFSKQDIVICKRFTIFCYLLDKLQEKAVLCLKEFLEFCFGPVSTPADSSKVGPVKSVPALWLKSARALIDILGHYHDKKDCVAIEHVIRPQKPLVDSTNFPSFCSIILNSVFECCILLKGVDDTTEREKVIKCLWGTVFYLAAVTDNSDCFEYISQILESIVEKSSDDAYFQKILMLIPSAFVTESKISIRLMEKLMKPMWKVLFNAENIPPGISDTFKHCITKIFANTTTVEEKIKIVKDVMREIVTVQISDKNVQTVNKIWLCLAKEISDEFGVEKLEQFDDFNNFLLWPAYFIHNLEETDRKQTVLFWMKLYRKLAQESDDKKIEIFKDLEKIFKNNPLLATNITSLVNIMSQFDMKHSSDFVCRLLGLVSHLLELPNLKNDDEHKLVSLMLHYLDPSLEFYAEQSEHHDVITKMCSCIKHTLCLHQSYKVLEPLGNFLRNSPQHVKMQFSKRLNELIADLYKKQSDAKSYAAKELQKVMVIFEEGDEKEKKVFVVPSGRSARIANLAKKSPRSPQKASPVKGSQLNNVTPTRRKKAANVVPSKSRTPSNLDDESASKFVAIDSEVKFQPSKLSEHQKEVLKRRRDDIPALYQDLSQSQSQDFTSKSNSNEVSQDQEEVKERRLSRDVAEVIEELNEFVQVRTPFEEEDKSVQEEQKVTEDQTKVKPMLSESLFSEEIIQESTSKGSEMMASKKEDTGNETTSDMTSLKVEETSSKPSDMSSLKVAEASSNPSDTTSKNVEETSNQASENSSMKIEVSSSKVCGITSSEEAKTSEMTPVKTDAERKVESTEPEDEAKPKEETNEERKKKKIAAELAKLRMNIVGADEYVASSRRRSTKPKGKQKEEEINKKQDRKSLVGQLGEKTASDPRKKMMESSSSENDTPKRIRRKPEQNVAAVKKPKNSRNQTPNANPIITDSNENVSASSDLENVIVSEVQDVSASDKSEHKSPKSPKKRSKNSHIEAPKKDLENVIVSEVQDVSGPVRCEHKSSKFPKKGSKNIHIEAPKKELDNVIFSDIQDISVPVSCELKSTKSPKKRSKNVHIEVTADVGKQTVPAIADQKSTKVPRRRSKVRDKEVGELLEKTTEPVKQKLEKSPKKGGKEKDFKDTKSPLSNECEQKTSKSPRRRSKSQHCEISKTPESQQVGETGTPALTGSGQKDKDSQRKMTHKRDLSRQLVNIGTVDESPTSIIQKDLKSPKKIGIKSDISEKGLISCDTVAADSPRKRVKRIVSEHSYVVQNVEAEHVISTYTAKQTAETQQRSEIEAKDIVSTSSERGHEEVVKSDEALNEEPTKAHITADEEPQEVISDSLESGRRKKKHTEVHVTADAENEHVVGFDNGEIKISKRKHKKKHSDHDSSEDGGDHLSGTKSPKKKSKKKHSVTPEKMEAVRAAELRFKKRLSDLESEIDHCRQFISQNETNEDDLVVVDNEVVSPSSESEDNKAIKIRLKRREDSGKKRRSKKDKYEVAQTEEEVGESRKRKLSTEEEYEDVIESSQESHADVSSLTNASKRRKVAISADTIDEETIVQKLPVDCHSHSTLTQAKVAIIEEIEADWDDQDTTQCTTATDDTTQESLHVEEQPETVKTVNDTQETLTQVTQRTQDTIPDIAEKIAEAKPEGCYFELPQKPDLTESEQIILEEIEIRATRTPEKGVRDEEAQNTPSTNSITSSPVTGDTPNRNSELLQDTIDISPISQGSTTTTTVSTCESVEISVAKALIFEPKEDHISETGNEENRTQCWSFVPPESLTGEDSSPEEVRDAETSDETKDPTTIQERSSKFFTVALSKSPLSHRRFARRRGSSSAKMSPSTGRIMRLMSNFNQKPQVAGEKGEDNDVRNEDLLTFSREVPSPLAVPRSSILKRKLSDSTDSDGLSPASKRKRVNFSDPCLTSKKIFIKDEDFQPSVEAKKLFDLEQQVKPTTLGQLFWPDGGETESEQPESEQSLDIASTTMLRKDRSIYPKLIGCEDDVIAILKRVTSPMFVTTLMNKLKDRDIRTIGELAQLSEVEVSRFPFKKDEHINKDFDVQPNECTVSTSAISPPRSVRINGFPERMEKESPFTSPTIGEGEAGDDNTKEPIEMAIVNLKHIISQSPMLDKTSKCIIRCLMETIGVSKLIDSVAALCAGDEDRATLLACLSRMTNDSDGDSTSIYATASKVHSLSEIKGIVKESMDVGEVKGEDVIEQCLLPLVQSPKDLYGYIDKVKVVQLGDLVVDRLKDEEVDEFLQRIISTYPKQSLQCVAKSCQSPSVTPTQLVSTFQSFLSDRSNEDQKEVMVEMFRYISSMLDPATLLTLHLEFLGGIRQVVENSSRL
nr:unnamed protein product [Callosobruchus analis]